MSTPRFYCWDDAGSPGRALSGNLQNRLKQILVPCLVTGYGDKPGAGWTIGHEHPNGFSLINADGNVINFVSNLPAQEPYPAMHGNMMHIYAAESITSTSGAVIEGANLCSGEFRAGTPERTGFPRHMLRAEHVLISQLSSLQWTILATDRTFILTASTSQSASSGWPESSITLYAGASVLDTGIENTFLVLGGLPGLYSAVDDKNGTFFGGSTSLRDPSTGLSRAATLRCEPYASSNQFALNRIYAGALPSSLRLQSPLLQSEGDYVGRILGCVYDPILSMYGWGVYLRTIGFGGKDYTDRSKLVTIGDYQYAYSPGHYGGFLLTNDPAFW